VFRRSALPQQTRKQLLQHPTWGERYHVKWPYLKLKMAVYCEPPRGLLAQWQFVTRSVARFFECSAKWVEAVSWGFP